MMKLSPIGDGLFKISIFGVVLFIANANIPAAASENPAQPDPLVFREIDSNILNKKNVISRPYPYESELKCPAFGDQLCKPATHEPFCIPSHYSCCGETLCSATEKCCGGGCCPKSNECIEGVGCCPEGKTCASDDAQIMTIMGSDFSVGSSQASTVAWPALSTVSSNTESGAKDSNAANAIQTLKMPTTTAMSSYNLRQGTGEATVSVMNSQARKTITQTMYTTIFNDMSHTCSGTSTMPNSLNGFPLKASSTTEAYPDTATNIKSVTISDDIATVGEFSETTVTNSLFDALDSVTDVTEADSNVNNTLTVDSAKPSLCYDSYMNRLEPCSSDNSYNTFTSNSTSRNNSEAEDAYAGSNMANEGLGLNGRVRVYFMTWASAVVLQVLFCYYV